MFAWLFSVPLLVGALAPNFTLSDDAGHTVSLESLRGKNVLLVFYPRDNTPGCTRQLCQLRDNWEKLRSKGVQVFGVNPQSADSHAGFREKQKLPFPLLVDKGQQVAALYHANGLVLKRTVYLIGADGKIRFAQRGAPSPDEILATLK
jgi:thioredoxin-dependent peroxiredoxin